MLELPTGSQSRGLGVGHVRLFLPVWVQKSFGDWTTYGAGGYWINQNDTYGDKNYWFVGWLLQRKITDKLILGGEIFHQTADSIAGVDQTGFNLGGQYDFDEHNHLLFSAGRGFQNASETNLFSWYLGSTEEAVILLTASTIAFRIFLPFSELGVSLGLWLFS